MICPAPPLCPPAAWTAWPDWDALMRLALEQAHQAAAAGEAPVGAVLLDAAGQVLGTGHNAPIATADPTAHAEILALRAAARACGNYRLPGSVLVCTLEPCVMCLGALVHARVAGVVFGALDAKAGALVSNLPGAALPFFNHRFWTLGGVLGETCGRLLSDFFRTRRLARQHQSPLANAPGMG
ncbi:putative CMP/dCMP deaminase zinc-binding protein [Megalodesulfovibrio gigas DSM 1382 = ATCC 19364]|uniref:tRNA-specific adenosine deaminase n=2 Tax=Megalodesulfovibrio gigas TaxID=879 RepID=T2GC75_MEGG1|nr:putative CMP/dCMP deaminase zinc-binding protein [Megalodesulfovibrio gigas DSM 1382 = ATCC 19364]